MAQPRYTRIVRPRPDALPDHLDWCVETQLTFVADAVEREALRRACFTVATNVLDAAALPDETLIRIYTQDQGGVERGFAFLTDPLFLASSVFLEKSERIVAVSCVMVPCLLVYRLAKYRLRQRLSATGQTFPNQVRKPAARPTMRWGFQRFEGIDRLTIQTPGGEQVLVLTLLGAPYRALYHLTT